MSDRITKNEFVAAYASRSQLSVAEILDLLRPEPCDCGEEGCQGWQMVSKKLSPHDFPPGVSMDAELLPQENTDA